MDADEHDDEDDHGVPELIGDLYRAAEADGKEPNFFKVLEDVKRSLIPGSKHSRFSFYGEVAPYQIILSDQQYGI